MNYFSSVFFIIIPITVNANGYNCQLPNKISPPDDLSQTVYWPSVWNDSMNPIQMEAQQNCEWDISVPEGMFATAVFYKDAPSNTAIVVYFPNNQAEGIDNNDNFPYIFTSGTIKVNLFKSTNQALFSFKIKWSKYPNVGTNRVDVTAGGDPSAQFPIPGFTTFTADSTVSLVAFSLKNSSHNPLLRQSAVFDGDSTNGAFLGNLYKIMMQSKAVVSSGKWMTVYTFGLDKQFEYTLYMAQDHSNDNGVFSYKGANCAGDTTQCKLTLNAVYGEEIVATAGSHPEFIKSIDQFPDNATLKIYEGAATAQNLVTTLTKDNFKNYLPLELKNVIRQYVLDSNILNFELSLNENDADWNKVYDGRQGFVHSFYHGEDSKKQDTNEKFTSVTPLFFNFIVSDYDLTGDQTKLTVTVFNGNIQVFSAVYTSINVPPTRIVSVKGDTYNIVYETHGATTKGFRIDFSTTSSGYETTASTAPGELTTTSQQVSNSTLPSIMTSTIAPPISTTTDKFTTSGSMETTTKTCPPSTNFTFLISFVSGFLLIFLA